MKKSFNRIVLIAILVLTFVAAAIPVAAAEPTTIMVYGQPAFALRQFLLGYRPPGAVQAPS
jgi:hypothetical protein